MGLVSAHLTRYNSTMSEMPNAPGTALVCAMGSSMTREGCLVAGGIAGVLACGCGPADGGLAVVETGQVVRVMIDDQLFTEYHYADAERPCFYPLLAPTGDNITRHWPMQEGRENEQHDHPHHRSLWFTHGDVNGHDFWTEGRGPRIVQTRLETSSDGKKATLVAENEWRAKDGTVVCTDRRTHRFLTSGDSRIIDFEITIKASHGEVVLGDTKEGSMAFRVAPTLRLSGPVAAGAIVNSEGVTGEAAWGKRARWCDYYGPLGGTTVGIAIMDHPDNPRHPTWWHARDYGLCAANPFGLSYFEKKPRGVGNMTITKGASVTFKYRVLIHRGTAEAAGIEKEYTRYTEKKGHRHAVDE